MILRLFMLLFIFVFHSCTNPVNSSLLTSSSNCSGDGCTTDAQTTISGSLEIDFDRGRGEIFSPIDGSDIVEVTGPCSDLGRKNNRILVQVYEGEDDSATPIIDNSNSVNCQDNMSTVALRGQQCLFISEGIGLADLGQVTPQFPQCFNGRFSFKLRLGRIIRQNTSLNDKTDTTNPKVKYLVKAKIRTTEGIVAESAPKTMLVDRSLKTPVLGISLGDRLQDRCVVSLDPSKFRDIRYTLNVKWEGPSYAASGTWTNSKSGVVYDNREGTFPPKGDGTTIEKFYHFGEPFDSSSGLLPGLTYTYQIQASDYGYVSDYMTQFGGVSATAVEKSDLSTEYKCEHVPPWVEGRTDTATTCEFKLAGTNLRDDYRIEWRVSDISPNWMETDPNSGFLVNTTNCRSGTACLVAKTSTFINASGVPEAFKTNVNYYFSARQYRDKNLNDQLDLGVDEEFIGKWSGPALDEDDTSQYTHACFFKP